MASERIATALEARLPMGSPDLRVFPFHGDAWVRTSELQAPPFIPKWDTVDILCCSRSVPRPVRVASCHSHLLIAMCQRLIRRRARARVQRKCRKLWDLQVDHAMEHDSLAAVSSNRMRATFGDVSIRSASPLVLGFAAGQERLQRAAPS